MGKQVIEKHIPSVANDLERIPLQNFTNGVYIISIKAKGQIRVSKKLVTNQSRELAKFQSFF